MSRRFKYLEGYDISACAVRSHDNIAFCGQKWLTSDPLEARSTAIFIFYPNKPAERRWACSIVGEATGAHLCATYRPDERWILAMDDGAIYVIGGGYDDYEEDITDKKPAYFTNIKCISNGYAYAVGTHGKIFRRERANEWVSLVPNLPNKPNQSGVVFSDIDGFNDSEIYACGDDNLWNHDGKNWRKIELPGDVRLRKICCGKDGQVYILTDQRNILIGRHNSWKIVEQKLTQQVLEDIVWYHDRVYVSTIGGLYEIFGQRFVKSQMKPPQHSSYAHLASGDGIFVVSGHNEASLYDGKEWSRVFESQDAT